MFTVLGGTALWALVPSHGSVPRTGGSGRGHQRNIYTFCAVIAYFWSFVLVRVWLVAQVSAEVSIALANVSLFAYIELADAARDARALRVCFEAEPAGALERLEYSLLITKFMPLFWVATVMVDLMVLFIFLKPVSFVSGHQETLLCTQWKAGFVVTPEVSRLSPLLEVFSTFVCAAAVGLIIPLIYTGSRILFQGVAPALLVLLVIALDRRLSQPEIRRRMSQFYVTVREMDPLQYVVASLFGIVFSGLWLWRHFMA
ncbi:hypothetical protein BC826DRAFT_967386 [Russula brevipes]|nr:hypothetical protein BC826DRAFT_967386 [Russula brevipes]